MGSTFTKEGSDDEGGDLKVLMTPTHNTFEKSSEAATCTAYKKIPQSHRYENRKKIQGQ